MRVDINMRLVIDHDSYAAIGAMMDKIDDSVRDALVAAHIERAAFDFTSFNTNPCKAIAMAGYEPSFDTPQQAMPVGGRELPLVAQD